MIREFTLTVVMKGRPIWGGLFFTAHDLLFNRGSRAALSGSKESARILSLFLPTICFLIVGAARL